MTDYKIELTLHPNQEFRLSNTQSAAFAATKILLPIDFSPSSEAALEAATGLAQQFHADIHLVHIIPEVPDFNGSDFFPETPVLQERRETIEEKLQRYKKQLMLEGVSTSFSIEEGNDIVGALMRVIERERADLVVISTHGMSGWHPLIFGSIAQEMVKQVSCTLLLLKSGQHKPVDGEPALDVWEDSFVPKTAESAPREAAVVETTASSQTRLDRVADDLAKKGGRTEQQYDGSHSIFTK